MSSATLTYSTSSHDSRVLARIARVAAAGRIAAERRAAERRAEAEWAAAWALVDSDGQLSTDDTEWCFVCARPTNHLGEHTPDQIDAWKATRV